MDEKTFYTIPEVAKILVKSEVTIRRYIKSKSILGWYKMGKEWRIEKDVLKKFIEEVKNKVVYE